MALRISKKRTQEPGRPAILRFLSLNPATRWKNEAGDESEERLVDSRTLRLTREERRSVEAVRSAGHVAARQLTRAHVLAALDDGVSVSTIAAVLGIDRTTVWRALRAFREGGVHAALAGQFRVGRPPSFSPEVAQWVRRHAKRLARAGAPASLSQLRDAAQQRFRLESLSRETVRRWLAADGSHVAFFESTTPALRKRNTSV